MGVKLSNKDTQAQGVTDYIVKHREIFLKVLQERDNDYLFALMMQYFDELPEDYNTDTLIEHLKRERFKYQNRADSFLNEGSYKAYAKNEAKRELCEEIIDYIEGEWKL